MFVCNQGTCFDYGINSLVVLFFLSYTVHCPTIKKERRKKDKTRL